MGALRQAPARAVCRGIAVPGDVRGAGSGAVDGFVRLGVSICHEILHPDLVAASVRDGARLLVNIANDGLLDRGYGIAASQQAAMAAFRAVETKRFLVRAATTGESVVIDPLGRTVERLPLGVAGTLRASVTEESRMTPYARFGDVFAAACVALGAAALVVALVSHRPRTTVSDPLLP
jgi:apolipoprotein N-acyltransferase